MRSGHPKCVSGDWPQIKRKVVAGSGLDSVVKTLVAVLQLLILSECAYALRYVDLNRRDDSKPWSIRQTVIYHKYQSGNKSSTWVMVSPSEKTEVCLDGYIQKCGDMTLLNPFEIHLLVLDTLLANWRPYIVDLTERITQQVR